MDENRNGGQRLKVLLASNMYAYAGNWDKLDGLARFVDLAVITPEVWGIPETGQVGDKVMRVPDQPRSARWRQYRLKTHIHGQGNPFRYFYAPGTIERVVQAERPDIVHVEQEPESLSLLQFSMLKLMSRYKLIFVAWEDHNPLRLGWGFRKMNYGLADAGIAGNQVAAERARKLGFRKRMEVIPQYGFEITYKGLPEARRADANGKFVVGYAGRLVPEKGIRTLVDATRGMPDTEVVMAGDGPLADEVRHEPHVRLLGWVPRTELDRFWANVDVMVLPSLTAGRKWVEQFGRVLVEAMAAGVPVVGSSSGRIPETIGDAGLVYPEGDARGLAAALDSLRENPQRRIDLTRRGLDRVRNCYTHEVLMGRTVEFYREVLAQGRS